MKFQNGGGTSTESAGSSSESAGSSKFPSRQASANALQQILKLLVESFDESVIQHLDKMSKEAVTTKERIEDPRKFAHVKRAIEDRILDLLLLHTDQTSVPTLDFFKKVVYTLANKYPYMFLEDPTKTVDGVTVRIFNQRGTGGVSGVDFIPKSLSQKYRRIIDKNNSLKKGVTGHANESVESEQVPKKRKLPQVYGVDKSKYYPCGSCTMEENLVEFLENLSTTGEREKAFEANRTSVQKLLTSSANMHSAVPGFFSDPSHCQKHFEWLTNISIVAKVGEEIPKQFEFLKFVLKKWCPTKEFWLRAEAAKLKCNDHDGSKIPEYVFLLRELNQVRFLNNILFTCNIYIFQKNVINFFIQFPFDFIGRQRDCTLPCVFSINILS